MADKKLFQDLVLTSTPLTTDRFALGKSGSAYKNITASDLSDWIIERIPTPTETFLTKVVNVGALRMDSDTSNADKLVALGVVRDKIRSCQVLILSNDGGLYPMALPAGNKEVKSWWYIPQDSGYSANARIRIFSEGSRVNKSFFNQGSFSGNGPGGNRGYIYVTYVA